MNVRFKLLLIGTLFIALAACSSNAGDPSMVIEQYVTALVEGDNAQSVNLSCASWEENARAEGASFEGVEVALDGMVCRTMSENGNRAVVACEGDIVFSYAGGEDEVIPLSRRNYVLEYEGGEWRMCGYE